MDKLSFNISPLSDERVCIEISVSGVSLGLIYYERAKKSFNKKPVSMDRWVCVDANIEGLYVYGGENITPKDIMEHCQLLLKSHSN